MSELKINQHQYLELEKLAVGAFAPLSGFMREEEFNSVVDSMRLPTGEVFPLPIVLDVTKEDTERFKGLPEISLIFKDDCVGKVSVDSIYTCDKTTVAKALFGTTDKLHPGVANFFHSSDYFVGGKVSLTQRATFEFSEFELTPEETRAYFAAKDWSTVAGFQTRNIPHRAHEYLQRIALEHVDGLFIQPLLGKKKKGDFAPEAILTAYTDFLTQFYPKDRVKLGILTTAMRYAGPREAIFHAIVRRNYGCTHFIVGRDHAGVGNYYGLYDAHELACHFDGELGIDIMRLHGPYYCSICDGVVTGKTCPHETSHPEAITYINGGDMRRDLSMNQKLDPRLMRPEVITSIQNIKLFIEEDGY